LDANSQRFRGNYGSIGDEPHTKSVYAGILNLCPYLALGCFLTIAAHNAHPYTFMALKPKENSKKNDK
jgi:hypothetical protein